MIDSDFFVVEADGQPPLLGLRACQELSLIKFVRTVDTASANAESILDEMPICLKALESSKESIILKLIQ